jgi:hypothetical protein
MLAFHMFCSLSNIEAIAITRQPLNDYLESLVDATSDWTSGSSSPDYPGYDKIIAGLKEKTSEAQVAKGAAWPGTSKDLREAIADYYH